MNRSMDWLEQAERDLSKAKIDLEYQYFEWACFTTQQAAEKAAKALAFSKGTSFWGHSVSAILRLLSETVKIPEQIIELGQILDAYYIPTRYPNGFDSGKPQDYYNRKMASEEIDAADKIIRFCRENIS